MKQLFKKPSYYLISSAMDGNEKAIEKLLAFYDPYISKCCLRSLYDEYGNVYIVVDMLWSSIFVTLMANKIGGLQFGIYRNCQISSRVFHTAVAALPLTKANRSDFE